MFSLLDICKVPLMQSCGHKLFLIQEAFPLQSTGFWGERGRKDSRYKDALCFQGDFISMLKHDKMRNEKKHFNFVLMLCEFLSLLTVFLSTLPFWLPYPCTVFFQTSYHTIWKFYRHIIWLQPPLSNFISLLVISTYDWDKLFLIATCLKWRTITCKTGRGKYCWKLRS